MPLNERDRTVIEKIIKYCDDIDALMTQYGRSYQRYVTDISFQYSCGMCLIQIGELAGRVSEETTVRNSHIAWRAIKAMRNIHAHDYNNIDYSIVWASLEEDIPALKQALLEILAV
ncbi:MAG: DUF86 domain-containing protein [Synergistaceae bacterium]|nr:DUF86 domain-containing protein [Synergistaceae bacterium]MBR0094951.1 DUF86 domain-containing protein [Synergistaceae bacterium]